MSCLRRDTRSIVTSGLGTPILGLAVLESVVDCGNLGEIPPPGTGRRTQPSP